MGFRPCLLLHSAVLLGLSDAFSWIKTDVAKEVRAGKEDLVVKCRVPPPRLPEITLFSTINNFSISLIKRDLSGKNEKSLVSIDYNVIHVRDKELSNRPGVNVTGSLNLRDTPGLSLVIDRNEIRCPEDSGVYVCLMSIIKNGNNMAVNISHQVATVMVTKPPESIEPILFYDSTGHKLNSRNFSEGTRLFLHCVGDAYMNSEIRWCIKRSNDATFATIHENVTTKSVSSEQCHLKKQSILTLEITPDNPDTEVLCESGYGAGCGSGIVKASASFTSYTSMANSTPEVDLTSAGLITSPVTSQSTPYKPIFQEKTSPRNAESEQTTSIDDPQESTQSTDFHDLQFTLVPSQGPTSDTELVANSTNTFPATATRPSVLTAEAPSTPTEVFLTEESTENTANPSVTQNESQSSQKDSTGHLTSEIYSSTASSTDASQTSDGSPLANTFTEMSTDTLNLIEHSNFLVESTLDSSDGRESTTATFETKPTNIPIDMLSFQSTQDVTTTRTELYSVTSETQQSVQMNRTQPKSTGMQITQQTQTFTSDVDPSDSSSPNLSIRTTSSTTNDIDTNSSSLSWSFLSTFSRDATSAYSKSRTTTLSPTESTETNTKETSSSVSTTDGTVITLETTNGADSTRKFTDMGRKSTVVIGLNEFENISTSIKTHTLKNDNQSSGKSTTVIEQTTLQSNSSKLSTTSAPILVISSSTTLASTHEIAGDNQSSGESTIVTERSTLHSNSEKNSSSWAKLDISTSPNPAKTHALISGHQFSSKNTKFTEQPSGILPTNPLEVLRTSVAMLDNSTSATTTRTPTSTRTHALNTKDQSSGKSGNPSERSTLESNTVKPTRQPTFQSNTAKFSTALNISKVQNQNGIHGRTTKLASSTTAFQQTRSNHFITTSPTTRRPKHNRHPAHHTKLQRLTSTPATKPSKRRTTASSILSKAHVTSTKPMEVVTLPTNWQTIQITVMTAMSVTVVVTMSIGLALIWKAKLQIVAVKIKPTLANV